MIFDFGKNYSVAMQIYSAFIQLFSAFGTAASHVLSDRAFLVLLRINATAINVRMSDTGMKKGNAYKPHIAGSRMGTPTPKTISRRRDSREDSFDLPSDCRKMKAPLFKQAKGKRQSWQRMNHTANCV